MRVAIYIEQGVTQLVLTPEGEWEQEVCAKMASNGDKVVTIMRGSFYECRGGWTRYKDFPPFPEYTQFGMVEAPKDASLILRVTESPEKRSSEISDAPVPLSEQRGPK